MVHEVFILCTLIILNVDKNKKFENKYSLEKQDKFAIGEMQDNKINETTKDLNVNKSLFSLPSVKELAKQFTIQESKELKHQTELESKRKTQYDTKKSFDETEPEVDYSTIPVSQIIHNLQQAAETPVRENNKNNTLYNFVQPATLMEVCRTVENNLVIEKYAENIKVPDGIKFNGKQVHSLTARSISKEFREGLKNNSYKKNFQKVDRISSSGESDNGNVVSGKSTISPAPSVDLKNVKKFWEEIITANSNSTKQK